jgi:hypothetical protein
MEIHSLMKNKLTGVEKRAHWCGKGKQDLTRSSGKQKFIAAGGNANSHIPAAPMEQEKE